MKPAPFTYHRAETVGHALSLLRGLEGDTKLLAGGQSLGPMLNLRMARPAHLVDLNDLLELDSVRTGQTSIEIGGMTRHHRLATSAEVRAACPVLAASAATIGHYAIRQRGTIGGSLSHADPAAQLPLIATLLNADIVMANESSTRVLPARQFFLASLVTALEPDEMITAVRFPVVPPQAGWSFEQFSQRHGDFAIASVAVLIALERGGAVESLSLALGGVGATPLAMDDVVQPLIGKLPDASWRSDVAQAVVSGTAPDEDARISAQYRKDLAASLTVTALTKAIERARRAGYD